MNKRAVLAVAVALALGLVPSAWAQSAGNIYGNITDESGAVLPGATVTLTGAGLGARSTTGGGQGDFRFLNLDPGTYKLSVALTGFTTVNREVRVVTGTNVNLTFGLKVATVEETVTVTAETPVVDTKKTGTIVTLQRDELEKIPQARDPWAVLRTVPGVLLDRVNIAGNESGQQAAFVSKGASDDDTQWNLDGVVITDMAASGASPTYYDFDAFEEISVSTGGNDIKAATGGISLNFVTKRGTNSFHGGGRYFLTHDDMQSSNLTDELLSHKLPSGAPDNRLKDPGPDGILNTPDDFFRDKADHIQQVTDYGFDLGGPVMKDKLWFYGSYGVQDIRNRRLSGTRDKTRLKSYNAKLNWQASSNDMISLFYFRGQKIKTGRGVVGGFQQADSFLWDQGDEKPEGGLGYPGLGKLEWNHVFSPNFFMNAKYAYYGTGFHLFSHGDISKPGTLNFVNRTAIGSSLNVSITRPQHTANLDANYFAAGMGGNHELKFGFGYRKAPVNTSTVYGGRMWGLDFGGGGLVNVYRDAVNKFESQYISGYAGDTFTKDRLTVNLGVRFDHQTANNRPSEVAANPDFPTLLPGLNYNGAGTGLTWDGISPRVGLSYALDDSRKTVVRASYAHYSGQVSSGDATADNPVKLSYLQYYWDDVNADGFPQKNEVLTGAGLYYYYNIDPANPAALTSLNKIDPDYSPNTDNEFVLGIDRELFPNFAVSAAYTFRRASALGWAPRVCGNRPCNRSDYVALAPVTRTPVGQGTDPQTFTFQNNRTPTGIPGTKFVTNRDDSYRQFQGVEVSLIKRLSNKWMGRLAFSFNDWTEHFKGGLSNVNVADPTRTRTNPLDDGGQVSLLSGGSGKQQLFSSVKWQVSANAMYQLPWDIEIAAALFGRQGHPQPVFLTMTAAGEPRKEVVANGVLIDDKRYADLWNVDFRLAKNIKIGSTSVALSAEVFNVFNSGTELTRTRDAASSAFNRLDEILSPRIARLGLRFLF